MPDSGLRDTQIVDDMQAGKQPTLRLTVCSLRMCCTYVSCTMRDLKTAESGIILRPTLCIIQTPKT